MESQELLALLDVLQPVDGEPPSWVREMEPEELVLAARWIRTQLESFEASAAAGALSDRLETYRAREGHGSMLRPLFDAALVALGASSPDEEVRRWAKLVDIAESALDGMPQVRAWLDALMAIVGDGTSTTEVPQDLAEMEHAAGAPAAPVHVKPQTLEGRCRSRVRAAASLVAEFDEAKGARWGIDFGTAWSKTAFRPENGSVDELAATTNSLPSIVAVERGGDRIVFGDQAADVSKAAQAWNVSTSMKRFLVGKRIDVAGMPNDMTTERLATLYVVWLLHQAQEATGDDLSPCKLVAHLSRPLARVGDQPQLRDFFSGGPVAPKRHYRDWLQKAFPMAQLIAVTYRGEPWPTSVSELLTLLRVWDQSNWNNVRRNVGLISEPAAVVGDFEPMSLSEGLTMLVDCGAGTTDVSVFWRRADRVFRVVEHSAVVGGDTVDAAIEAAVLDQHPELGRYRSNIVKWARDVKPELLATGAIDFDPDIVLELRGALPSRIAASAIQPGLEELGLGVRVVVADALKAAESALLEARPPGVRSWPSVTDLQEAWFSGGTAAVKQVPQGIDTALRSSGVPIQSKLLEPPAAYSGWSADRYRTMSCAAGASRRELLRPEDLKPDRPGLANSLSNWDKDAG